MGGLLIFKEIKEEVWLKIYQELRDERGFIDKEVLIENVNTIYEALVIAPNSKQKAHEVELIFSNLNAFCQESPP